MKTPILNLRKSFIAFVFTLASYNQLKAQCSVQTTLSVLPVYLGYYQVQTAPTIPQGWDADMYYDFGDGTFATANYFSVINGTYTTPGNHNYYANGTYIVSTYMSAFDPNDTTLSCNAVDYDTVVVSNLPCSMSVGNIDMIQGNGPYTYDFSSTYVSGNPGVQTTWILKDTLGNILNTVSAYDNTNYTYTFSQSGWYIVSFAAYGFDSLTSLSCSDSTSLMFNIQDPWPTQCNASFYMWQDSLNTAQWYAINNSTGNGPLSYTWDFGDGTPVSVQAYPSHTYSTPGNYVICLTIADSTGCSSSTCDSSAAFRISQQQSVNGIIGSLIVSAPLGITQKQESLNRINLFPNPMQENTTISFEASHSSNARIEIVNVLGQLISKTQYEIKKGNNEIKLNTASLLEGVYSINVFSNNQFIGSLKAVK